MILKVIYTFFIGILLTLFIGFGIAAFYEEPKYPEPSVRLRYPLTEAEKTKESTQTAMLEKEQMELEKREKAFQKDIAFYNRNVSTIALAAAIIYLVISLILAKRLLLISDGLLLGGVFTLIYSIGRGFGTNDNMFQFITVSAGLFIALILGYFKFIKPAQKK